MKLPATSRIITAALVHVTAWSFAQAQEYAKGKISRNIYRVPYANSMYIRTNQNDYVNHGGSMDSVAVEKVCAMAAATPCGSTSDCGAGGGVCQEGYCTRPCDSDVDCSPIGGTCEYVLVAPADGIVCQVIDHYNDCGCNRGAFGSFGNNLVILHANAEMTRFLHIKQGSASLFGVTAGMLVQQGQAVGIEGDVGNTCDRGGTPPRVGSCLSDAVVVPAKACFRGSVTVECLVDADCSGECNGSTCVGGSQSGMACPNGDSDCADECRFTSCGRHIHWNITRYTTGEVVNPFTCGIPDNLHDAGSTHLAPCGEIPAAYPTNATLATGALTGQGTFRILQAYNTITGGATDVSNRASLVLHAGNKITVAAGFKVHSDAYFRAEIESPDWTAASGRPIPSSCPCTDAMLFCYQWSDPASPDGVTQGCDTPGPTANSCHGCETLSGGTRCCSCILNDSCAP
jgi:hypothetical protein